MLSKRIWRSVLNKLFFGSKPKHRWIRPRCEQLEDRVVPATITWNNPSGGNWDLGSNWVGGVVPGKTDQAVIDTAGTATITIQSSDSIQVQSVATNGNDTLAMTGGTLEITLGASTFSGPLTMTGGTLEATGSGVTLAANGATSMTDVDLDAESGASIGLPELTSLDADGSTFRANGSDSNGVGSVLNVSALTGVTQMSSGWFIYSTSKGTVNLSGLTGSISTSPNSVKFTDTGGTLLLNGGLTSLNGVYVTVNGSDANVANDWTSFTNGTLYVQGGSYSLPDLTDVDGSSLYAESGGQLTLPNLTSYDSNGYFEAVDAGSVLDVSALTTLTQTLGNWHVNALTGGELNLSGISNLTSTAGISIDDTGNSLLIDPNLKTLSGVNSDLDGTDSQVASAWTAFTSGTFTLQGGTLNLPGLNDVNDCDLNAENGGQLTLPNLTSYDSDNTTFVASSTGSVLNVSALTTLTQNHGAWAIDATAGGTVNLASAVTLTSTNGITFEVGANGVIDLTDLAELSGPNTFSFNSGGTLDFPSLTRGNITLSNGQSATVQGTLVSMPASNSSNVTINVPQTQGLTIALEDSGTFTNSTFNVGNGTTLDLSTGNYLGGTTFNVATGATVSMTGIGAMTYAGLVTGSGGGTVVLNGNGPSVSPNTGLFIGTGGLTLNFPSGMFEWTGEWVHASQGDLTNLGSIVLTGSIDSELSSDGTLYNYGTMIQNGSGNLALHSDSVTPTTFFNEPGGTYIIESDSGIDNPNQGTTALINEGTIEKTEGMGTSDLFIDGSMSNTGTIEAESGTLFLNASSIAQLSGTTITGGTWSALNGASLEFPTNTSIAANAANISLGGSGAEFTTLNSNNTFVSALAALTSNSGNLTIGSATTLATTGNFTNSGTLTIGGAFDVGDNFIQASSGIFSEEIGGTPGSGQFGQIAASGMATLAGTLNASLVNGYAPTTGQQYNVLTFASVNGTFTTFTGLSTNFSEGLTTTAQELIVLAQPVDLVTSNVSAPTTAISGQPITVTWQVTNLNNNPAGGSWQDSVYLSSTTSITSSSVLLASVPYSAGLAVNGQYQGTWTGTVPAVLPGTYFILVQADSLYQTPDTNRANNIAAAGTSLAIGVPALTLGTPLDDAFTAADQNRYYQVNVAAGGSLQFALASAATGGVALYASQGTLPTTFSYQFEQSDASISSPTLTVPTVSAATTYYVLAHSIDGAAASASFTLTATQGSALTVTALPSPVGSNYGNFTLEIDGTNFSANTTATLTSINGINGFRSRRLRRPLTMSIRARFSRRST